MKVSVIFAQENFEVISGLCYQLDADTKQAVVMPNEDEEYSGDIVIPETVTAKDGKVTGKEMDRRKPQGVMSAHTEAFEFSH